MADNPRRARNAGRDFTYQGIMEARRGQTVTVRTEHDATFATVVFPDGFVCGVNTLALQ